MSKLNKIISLFDRFSAFLIEADAGVTDVSPYNEGLEIETQDSEGRIYSVKVNEAGIAGARIVNGNLIIEDVEGDEAEFSFKETKRLLLTNELD